ncbi:hypothetical protein, partial [uncultured Desulfovibrio sp.]|uniref:hypothetical protein n=1 Tax=uncultured Desulfovibrio sp. TaxID=167968 RepID=UPI00262A13B6
CGNAAALPFGGCALAGRQKPCRFSAMNGALLKKEKNEEIIQKMEIIKNRIVEKFFLNLCISCLPRGKPLPRKRFSGMPLLQVL